MIAFSASRPLVVASVNAPEDLPAAADCGSDRADLLEWRLDGLQSLAPEALHAAMAGSTLPALLTSRRADEGGFAAWADEATRMAALDRHAPLAAAIDIEARSLAESESWREAARRWRAGGAALVVSFHDFSGIPSRQRLLEAIAAAGDAGATVFKVAATAQSLGDVTKLSSIWELAAPLPVSVMAMGKFGLASRLLFATAGSVLNYGFLRAASVPGQWPAAGLLRVLRESGVRE